jgi:VIT1/CCC1 family predicted Fe2+/Mn2+ transporter
MKPMLPGGIGWVPHRETHRGSRSGWLRAAVLGADDGIVSIASLLVGVAAANASRGAVITAGVAGLVAGAMSMAAGEYVSVSSQRDAERGDLAKETAELAARPDAELDELTQIYLDRGLSAPTARQVAVELTARDALAAHARDELGLIETLRARPLQAAVYSAASFVAGALLPMVAVLLAPTDARIAIVTAVALAALAGSGALAGVVGGANPIRGAVRVTIGGGLAMAATALIGWLAGVTGL